jgi:chemotaxis protein CheX
MTSSDEVPNVLKLPAVLDLTAASRLHEQVLALQEENIAVDATEVSRVGAQCIQVLLSAAESWRVAGRTFSVNQASEAFAKSLQLLGVADESVVPMEIV